MATTYYKVGPLLDAYIEDPTAMEDVELTFPVLTIEASMGNQAVMTLPSLSLSASTDDLLWCGALNSRETPLEFPGLTLDARFEELIELFDPAKLPIMSLEASFAPRLEDNLNLPVLALSATIEGDYLLSLSVRLPSMTLEANSGVRATAPLNLPSLSISAEMESDIKGTLDKDLTFPVLSVTISSDGWGGTLDKDLTFPALSASMSEDYTLSLDATLPGFKITASILSGATGELAENIPVLQLSALGLAEEFGSLNANLPTPVIGDVASGDGSGQGDARLTDRARFDDVILRHSRW